MRFFIASLLAVWFGVVFFAGARMGSFVRPPDQPPASHSHGRDGPVGRVHCRVFGVGASSGRRFSPPTSGC